MGRRRWLATTMAFALCACTAFASFDGLSESEPPPGEDAAAAPAEASTGGTHIAVLGGRTPSARSGAAYVAEVREDGSLGAWRSAAPMPEARDYGSAVAGSGVVHWVGGEGAADNKRTFIARITGGDLTDWAVAPAALPSPRRAAGLVMVGERLLSVGGESGSNAPNARVSGAALSPDGAPTEWRDVTPLPAPRSRAAVVAVGRSVFVVGGITASPDGGPGAASSEVFAASVESDGSLAFWRTSMALPAPTSDVAGVATGTHVVVVGGTGRLAEVSIARLDDRLEIESWTAGPRLRVGRSKSAAVIARGHVYVIGGAPETGAPTASVEVARIELDGTLSSWQEATPLPAGLERHAAVSFVPP